MIITKANANFYTIADKIEWSNVEVQGLAPELEDLIRIRLREFNELQDYLEALYVPLRQTGAADVSNVEAPQWLQDQVSKPKSTSGSKKKASASTTRKKASSSGSPKKQTDSSATSADTPE